MGHSFKIFAEWAEHDGKTVYLNGLACRIRADVYMQRYPYEQQMITVHAEPKNKRSAYYREIKAKLGDDWSTDVLSSDPEVYCDILMQCRNLSSNL